METVADFKSRITIRMRQAETDKIYSVVGASRASKYELRSKKVRCPKCGQWKESKTAWCPNYRSHGSGLKKRQKRFVTAP